MKLENFLVFYISKQILISIKVNFKFSSREFLKLTFNLP